jgi:hypothetical protein
MTVRRHIASWVALSRTRRIAVSLAVAAVIGGTTFGACRASDIAGPNLKSQYPASDVSRSLGAPDSGLITSDHDSDSDAWLEAPSRYDEVPDGDVDVTVVATQFRVTEAVYNSCRNELAVLNGTIKTWMRLEADPLSSGMSYKLQEWQDTRGVYGTVQVEGGWGHDRDSDTPPRKRLRTIRYHNKERLLDKFDVGPTRLPFRSTLETRMHLEREGADPLRHVSGDDLFVYVKQEVKTDRYGNTRTRNVFRSECN